MTSKEPVQRIGSPQVSEDQALVIGSSVDQDIENSFMSGELKRSRVVISLELSRLDGQRVCSVDFISEWKVAMCETDEGRWQRANMRKLRVAELGNRSFGGASLALLGIVNHSRQAQRDDDRHGVPKNRYRRVR